MSSHTYRSVDVTVTGGMLRIGIWEPIEVGTEDVPTALAIHGITANHQAWSSLPQQLPGWRIVAPDLRGRGRSNALPGPYGMKQHAQDLRRVLSTLDISTVSVLGHSMGGFVAVELARHAPDAVNAIILIDGGLPFEMPAGVNPEEVAQVVLGPALRRLAMTFPDPGAHREFWAEHPAFGPELVTQFGAYFDYDLEAEGETLRSAANIDAVTADQRELVTSDGARVALAELADMTIPMTFVHAPRGLLDADPLYPAEYAASWVQRTPALTMVWADGVNHYTVVMSNLGARLVARLLTEEND